MTHHNPDLCWRLAANIMDFTEEQIHRYVPGAEPDYCCDSRQSWMLEQKMAELGGLCHIQTLYTDEEKTSTYCKATFTGLMIGFVNGANPFHAKALAAEAALIKSCHICGSTPGNISATASFCSAGCGLAVDSGGGE